MEPKLRALPVGFRFQPTEVEMSKSFLKKKVLGQPMRARTIPEECHYYLFSTHPRALPGDPREEHWYFYSKKLKDQVTSNSQSVWTQIGEETNVLDPNNNDALVGIKRSFSLIEQEEEEEESNENICLWDEEESWFMDEISLPKTVAESDWVLCHVFRKNIKPEPVVCIMESSSEEDEEEESVVDKVAESLDLLMEKDGTPLPPSPSSP